MKYKVIIKPEIGEALSNIKFNDESEADAHIEGLRASSDDLFARTSHNLLIVVKYVQVQDEWVEVARESLLR